MSDVECPYCGQEQEINHDDGYGYDEGVEHEQECSCGKIFKFTTSIIFHYNAFCQDDDHNLEQTSYKFKQCTKCDYYE